MALLPLLRYTRIFLFLRFATIVGNAATGFEPANVSSEMPMGYIEGTYGFGFIKHPTLPADYQLLITSLGVFDDGGDGLVNSHPVAIWDSFGNLLASGIVPAGTEAPLVGNFRYINVQAVVPLNSGARVGAFYSANDADGLRTPNAVEFSPEIYQPQWGYLGPGDTLTFPTVPVSRGMEGAPNYQFYPVNFQFEVVPEPTTTAIVAVGLAVLVVRKRRSSTIVG